MNITYGMASKNNIVELQRLRSAYLHADFGDVDNALMESIMQELPSYFERHLGTDLHAHVAWDNDYAVGTCWLLVTEKPASVAFPHGRTGAIFNVYVDPAYRKRGIARKLMNSLIAQAHELNLDRLELRATAMGYNLYRSIGFVEDESSHRAMNYEVRKG